MIVGVPKETKKDEYRVAMLPVGVEELVRAGHAVIVERTAGAGSGLPDEAYEACGARLVDTAAEVFASAELIVTRLLVRISSIIGNSPKAALCRKWP